MFSMFRRGRQAAKEHAAKQAELKKKEELKTPYRHIPKHAAIDAMSSAPASSRDADRPRILEQHRRRNTMMASGTGTTTPAYSGLPRNHSTLSHVSYPAMYASPVIQIPRAYSYNSMPAQGWTHLSDIRHDAIDVTSSRAVKGKGVDRIMVDSGRASRSSIHSKDAPSPPSGSSNNSITSQDDLELKPIAHSFRRQSDPGRFTTPFRPLTIPGDNAYFAAAGIPPVPPLPPIQFDTIIVPDGAVGSATVLSRKSSPTLAPETVLEDPTEADKLDDLENIQESGTIELSEFPIPARKATESTVERSRFTTLTSALPTRLPLPQEPALPPVRQKMGKLMDTPSKEKGKNKMWTLRSGKIAAVAI